LLVILSSIQISSFGLQTATQRRFPANLRRFAAPGGSRLTGRANDRGGLLFQRRCVAAGRREEALAAARAIVLADTRRRRRGGDQLVVDEAGFDRPRRNSTPRSTPSNNFFLNRSVSITIRHRGEKRTPEIVRLKGQNAFSKFSAL
jgi:hypothetical protein